MRLSIRQTKLILNCISAERGHHTGTEGCVITVNELEVLSLKFEKSLALKTAYERKIILDDKLIKQTN